MSRVVLASLPTLLLLACGQNVILDYDPDASVDAGVPGDMPLDVSRDMSPGDASRDVSEDMPEDMPEDMSEDMEDMPEDVGDMPEDMSPYHPTYYPPGALHSPISTYVLDRLEEIASRTPNAHDNVFIKVGDSNTVNTRYLQCFASNQVTLPDPRLQPTLEHFTSGTIDGTTPFERISQAATVGWSANAALAGSPSPLEREITTASPRFATVMFGTNDIQRRKPFDYADQMFDLVDALTQRGVIPILTTIPARNDNPDANLLVPRYNAITRGLAQARQLPLLDLHGALKGLPSQGLGGDGLHLNAAPDGACDFGMEGMMYGHNVRNLHTLTALDRLKRTLLDGGTALDPTGDPIQGVGTVEAPFLIKELPFTDLRDTTTPGIQDLFDEYPGCSATQNESGPEYVYQFVLDTPATVRAMVFDRGDVDIDLHILDVTGRPSGCLERAHQSIETRLEAGTYHLVLDTFVSRSNGERAGEYMVVLLQE